jgi:glucosylceramidase
MLCGLKHTILCGLSGLALSSGAQIEITVDADQTYQTMHGFGAALTESSAWLLQNRLNDAQRNLLLEELFSPTNGIGLSILRLPVGSSDFRLVDFTYDDVDPGETDESLSQFSIARDEQWVIPTLQSITNANTNLQLIATPWSPPAWMKDSESLNSGSLETQYYEVFGNYLSEYVQAYAAQGLSIVYMTLQNEPLHTPYSYPGATLSISQQIALLPIVGRIFTSNGLPTKLLCFDHNWSDYAYPNAVLSNSAARDACAGTAFHGYEGTAQSQSLVHAAHPDKEIHITEMSSGLWGTNFGYNLVWDVANLIVRGTRNYASSVLKWNLALDPSGGPKISGGCSDCTGIITIDDDGIVTRNHDYYALAHAAAFIQPGAVRIGCTDNGGTSPLATAFKNPDDTIVLVTYNSSTSTRNCLVRQTGESFCYPLPASSVATFVWTNQPGADVAVWLTTGDQTALLDEQPDGPAFAPTTLTWKGRTWTVRDYYGGPGPNYWATDCVWVDSNDALHIAMKYRQGVWYCGEVISTQSPTYGRFDWYLQGRPDLLDSNTVGGLFIYADDTHEIDIEFARAFSSGNTTNLVYTIQPYNIAGHQHFETIALNGSENHHRFDWHPQRIAWESRYGTTQAPNGTFISSWTYTGYDVPPDTTERIFMNVWKFRNPPSDTNHIELVINDFEYTPFNFGAAVKPEGAYDAGGKWRINGGPWITGGQAFNQPTGVYTVECAEITGWIAPDPLILTLTNGASLFPNLVYTAKPQTPETFDLKAFALTNQVILRWSDPRRCGFTNRNVLLRFATNEYPATQSDGSLLYQGPDRTATHNNLTPGRTYYYTIWTTQDGSNYVTP